MKRFQLIIGLFIGLSSVMNAQCPTVGFVIPDSVCSGTPLTIQNTSIGSNALNFSWDFNTGDLLNTPTGQTIGNYASALTNSRGVDLVQDSGNYYAVSAESDGRISVINFGNSLNNIPVVTDLGNLGALTEAFDITIIKDQGEWFGFVSELTAGIIYKLSFGTSLLNIPIATALTSPGISGPSGLTAIKDQGNTILLASNYFSNTVSIINFGTSFQNSTFLISSIPVGGNPFGISILKKCDQWYGYVSYLSSNSISIIDFGSTISGVTNNFNPNAFSLAYTPRKSISMEDGGNYFLFFTSINRDALTEVNLGTNPLNPTPSIKDLGSFGIYTDHLAFSIKKFGSKITGIANNYDTGDLIKFNFPETNGNTISTSSDSIPNIFFPSSGTYQISLTVFDSLTETSNTSTDSIYVKPNSTPSFASVQNCEGNQIELIDSSNYTLGQIVSQNWDMGDLTILTGDTIHHLYNSYGSFPVVLTSINDVGCSATYSDTVHIYGNPLAGFSLNDTACAGSTINIIDTSILNDGIIQSWNWDFGGSTSSDQNPIHSFITVGTSTVKLIVTSQYGCADSVNHNITIIPGPFSSFTVSNSCIGESAFFNNQSIISSGLSLNSYWDFGDNNTSSLISPTHTYSNIPSSYFVQLISEASNGCRDTVSDSIRIGLQPDPNFIISKDTACALSDVQFTDMSIAGNGESIIARYWDFGDGSHDSTSINPIHQYLLSGIYVVTLVVVSPTYCDSSISKQITIIESPTAYFSSSDICFGSSANFTDSSTTPAGSILTNWNWNFGDNDTSVIQNPIHNYLLSGIFNITLSVTNSFGCKGIVSKPLQVFNNPIANFSNTKACSGNEITFNDSSTITGSTINSWNWEFGDTSPSSNIQNPTHIYGSSAAFPVTLIVSTNKGCIDTITKFIIVEQTPDFNILTNSNCLGVVTSFNYQPIGIPSINQSFVWDFGDSTFAFQANPNHIYISTGYHYVALTITDLNNACFRMKLDTIQIFNKPVAQFATTNSCINDSIKFTDLSTIQQDSITNWNWTFATHGNSTAQNPYLFTTVVDSFPVKLVIMSNNGCKDSIIHYAQSYPLPIVHFTANPFYGTPPLMVQFTNLSDSGGYIWNFGNGNPNSTLMNPLNNYNDTGLFNVNLIVTNLHGCIDSSSEIIKVVLPFLDLSIENINLYQENLFWKISATLKNTGILEVSNFRLGTRIFEATSFTEEFKGINIPPGTLKNIIFNVMIPITSLKDPEYLCVNIDEVNGKQDDNNKNNNLCNPSHSQFNLYSIYPNPWVDNFQIELNLPKKGAILYTIYNSIGSVVYQSQKEVYAAGVNQILVPNLNLSKGTYLFELNYNDEIVRKKIVKM